jgi:GT2 family glycosyltransferase
MREHRHVKSQRAVSVIITTFNRPELLREALSSVMAQESLPDEVFVVADDGGTPEMHPSVSALPVTTLTTTERRGVSAARNLGARAAHGEWLAFLDDDDWWLTAYLKSACHTAESLDADVVCTSFLVSRGTLLEPEKSAPTDLRSSDFYGHNPGLRASNLLIRRTLFLDLGGFAEDLPALNDIDLGLRLAAVPALRYGRVADRLVVFRHHEGPRLTSRRSQAMRAAVPVFLARHHNRMDAAQRVAFLTRVKRLWDIELD